MTNKSYQQFCPVAMAAETLCTRWTVVLLRELVAGSTRFNELRRGVPRMSPALLSKRLQDLEEAGIVKREPLADAPEINEYRLTQAGRDLQPVIEAIGIWGQKWVETEPSLNNLDPEVLMWDMRRNLDTDPVPDGKRVIEFIYPELPESQRKWWLVVEPDRAVDLCHVDPGFDVDLYISTDLRTMTEIWMGLKTVARAVDSDKLTLVGNSDLANNMQVWLGLSPFARQEKLVA
ncbi:MAG: helix-turn-helix transcriptional regulator [Roseovarius sp.]|nr:helix-turn-helix transcriptional regulator [Roseovarius sp.]